MLYPLSYGGGEVPAATVLWHARCRWFQLGLGLLGVGSMGRALRVRLGAGHTSAA